MADELREKLRAIVAEIAEIDEVPDATPFKDLGIDSMMAIEIVADVERQYKVKIPEDELATITDLDSVVRLVQSKLPEMDPDPERERLDAALTQASDELGLQDYYRDCVRPLLRMPETQWPSCCGRGCEPCADTLCAVAERMKELLAAGEEGKMQQEDGKDARSEKAD